MITCGECFHFVVRYEHMPGTYGQCSLNKKSFGGFGIPSGDRACSHFKTLKDMNCSACIYFQQGEKWPFRTCSLGVTYPNGCPITAVTVACQSFQPLTLADVCFSCQHFHHNPWFKCLSSGDCVQKSQFTFDGLKRKKCGDYIPKHGVYPNKLRVIRFRRKDHGAELS
jgi:hypothetical protein